MVLTVDLPYLDLRGSTDKPLRKLRTGLVLIPTYQLSSFIVLALSSGVVYSGTVDKSLSLVGRRGLQLFVHP